MRLLEAWKRWKADRALSTLYAELHNDLPAGHDVPVSRPVLKRLSIEALHSLAADAVPERQEAARWELTRRQGLPAIRVAWAAFAVSVAALAVSIVWHG